MSCLNGVDNFWMFGDWRRWHRHYRRCRWPETSWLNGVGKFWVFDNWHRWLKWLHCPYSTIELHHGNHLIQAPRQFIHRNSWFSRLGNNRLGNSRLDDSRPDNSRPENSCRGIRSGCWGASLRHGARRRGCLLYIWPCAGACSHSADCSTRSWCCATMVTDDVLHRLRCCRRCSRRSATDGVVLSARELSGHADPPDHSRENALELRL